MINKYSKGFRFALRLGVAVQLSQYKLRSIPFIFSFFLGFLLFFYYLIFNTKARNQLYTILSKNDISVLRFLWGIPSHSRFFRLIGLLLIPKVKIQREIYVPLDNKKKVRCILFSDISYEEILKKKKLILHYHGGGFSTMRPEDHQSYLREWAKKY